MHAAVALDVLWVIDGSCHQSGNEALAAVVPEALAAVEARGGAVRLGAVLDSGTDGALERVDGRDVWEGVDAIAEAMARLAETRINGSVIDARRRALAAALAPGSEAAQRLAGSHPLHVIMSSREEDESGADPSEAALFRRLAEGPREVLVHTTGWAHYVRDGVGSLLALSEATGGVAVPQADEALVAALQDVWSPRARYFLAELPDPGTLEVVVGDEPAHLAGGPSPSPASLPFDYDPTAVAVLFPYAQPAAGQTVTIRYLPAASPPDVSTTP